jgi:hypothetical protein
MSSPSPNTDSTDCNEYATGWYTGIKDGAIQYTGSRLETKPAVMAISSGLGWKTQADRIEEKPKTLPLCRSRLNEPLNSRKAPREVCTGVNILSRQQARQQM